VILSERLHLQTDTLTAHRSLRTHIALQGVRAGAAQAQPHASRGRIIELRKTPRTLRRRPGGKENRRTQPQRTTRFAKTNYNITQIKMAGPTCKSAMCKHCCRRGPTPDSDSSPSPALGPLKAVDSSRLRPREGLPTRTSLPAAVAPPTPLPLLDRHAPWISLGCGLEPRTTEELWSVGCGPTTEIPHRHV
jgi:hypothetical protein